MLPKQVFSFLRFSLLEHLALLWLVVFPLSTIWIYQELFFLGAKWEYGTLGLYGVELFGWMIILLVMMRAWRAGGIHHTPMPKKQRLFFFLLLCFFCYSLFGMAWALDSSLVLQQTTRLMLAVIMAMVLPQILTRAQLWWGMMIGAIFPVGLGIVQFFTQRLYGSVLLGLSDPAVSEAGVSVVQFGDERWLRAYGTFAHPNIFGGYVAMVLIICLAGALWQKKEQATIWFMRMFVIFLSIGLLLSLSRSAWLGAAIGMMILGVVAIARRQWSVLQLLGIAMGTMIIGGMLLWPLISVRLGIGSLHEVSSIAERIDLIDSAQALFFAEPWRGVGAGNMTAAMIDTYPDWWGNMYQPVHLIPLLLLVEYGLIGGVLGMCLVLLGSVLLWKKHALALVLSVGVLLPLALFDHYLWTSVHGLLIAFLFLSMLLLSSKK